MHSSRCAWAGLAVIAASAWGQQLPISRVDLLPDLPSPYKLRDWKKTALALDRVLFDAQAKGKYLPLIWRVPGAPNLSVPGFGIPSYVGNEEQRGKVGEAIAQIGALLGGTAIGIDERKWVELTPEYLSVSEGTVLNNPGSKCGASFWYDLLPSLDFVQTASRYPAWSRGREISRGIADAWIKGMNGLGGNFDHLSFDFTKGQPVDNGLWKEPDSAAAVAYLELFEATRSRDMRYLTAARRALLALQKRDTNPTYEVLTAYGVLSAAYLNAEKGDHWDVPRFVNWCFDPTSPNRVGWGMIVGNWGGIDAGGLMGSTTDGGGYAFAMNTFVNVGMLAPVARYDSRYSAALGKWLLNVVNASRLYYRDSLPANQQSSADWPGDTENGISYEGLHRTWNGKSPFAAGDAKHDNPLVEDLGIYGAGYVGLLGALVHETNVPMILRIDLRATDFLPVKGYPTDLLWNPYPASKTVTIDLGPTPVRPYDAVRHRYLSAMPVHGPLSIPLASHQAVQVVRVPPTGPEQVMGNRTFVKGIPIDYNNGRVPLPAPKPLVIRDQSLEVPVVYAGPDGTIDWTKSGGVMLNGGAGSRTLAELKFAWDDSNLYFLISQRAPATDVIEAKKAEDLKTHWWDFEDVVLNFDPGRGRFAVTSVPEVTVGWSSAGVQDLAFSPDIANLSTITTGTAKTADRTISGHIAWADLYRAFGTREPLAQIAKAGSRIGCQPLMVDGTFKRQAYIGGTRYTRPTGFDKNSRTLVLLGP